MEFVIFSNMSKTGFDFRVLNTETPFCLENNFCIDNTPLMMTKIFQMSLFSDAKKADVNLKYTPKEL